MIRAPKEFTAPKLHVHTKEKAKVLQVAVGTCAVIVYPGSPLRLPVIPPVGHRLNCDIDDHRTKMMQISDCWAIMLVIYRLHAQSSKSRIAQTAHTLRAIKDSLFTTWWAIHTTCGITPSWRRLAKSMGPHPAKSHRHSGWPTRHGRHPSGAHKEFWWFL